MELEEEKILEFYKNKRFSLLRELNILDQVIANIEYRVVTNTLADKDKWSAEFDLEFETKDNLSIEKVQGGFVFKKVIAFHKAMTYNEKVLFALNKLEYATVYEMVDFLSKYETIEDEDKFFQGLTMAASTLKNKGEIDADKEGKRNKYKLKIQHTQKYLDKLTELSDDPGEM